jgi:hypothetical protein
MTINETMSVSDIYTSAVVVLSKALHAGPSGYQTGIEDIRTIIAAIMASKETGAFCAEPMSTQLDQSVALMREMILQLRCKLLEV